jgi:hypothetical protein
MTWITKEIKINDIKSMLEDYDVEVDSPDGFVPVSLFVDKGEWDEFKLTMLDGRTICVNENHLFETDSGWQYAKDLVDTGVNEYISDTGTSLGILTKTGNRIPIVDIQVEHENHRYYTNGISSHNTGVGKSLFMCHMAAAVLMQGKNVLYITMEMAEERIAERIDANLLNMTMEELSKVTKDIYETRLGKLIKKTTGKLIIKEYPTAAAHSGHFKALLEELKMKLDFSPDLIVIDYLNICSSARMKAGAGVNSYTFIKSIAEELRGLAVEYNVPILSATQTTRGGFGNTDVGLEDTSESFGLPATTDLMFALISTEELENLNQIMVKQLKNRYNDVNYYKRFVIGVDRARMKLYDVEESAQKNISDAGQDDSPGFDKTSFGKRMKSAGDMENFNF